MDVSRYSLESSGLDGIRYGLNQGAKRGQVFRSGVLVASVRRELGSSSETNGTLWASDQAKAITNNG